MKVVIIEDERLSADHLHLLLQKIDAAIEVIANFDTVKATVAAFENGLQADLLFLDIHLADGNGFEVFQKTSITIPVIFTTAFDNYAIRAFKQNSIDYLLKPISVSDLSFAIEKYKQHKNVINNQLTDSIKLAYQQMNTNYKSRFLVKIGQNLDYINVTDILFFETRESLSYLVTKSADRYLVEYTLDQLEVLLSPKDFFRTNRGIIINIGAIEKVQTHINGRLAIISKQLEGDSRIVSRDRVNDFKKWLDN